MISIVPSEELSDSTVSVAMLSSLTVTGARGGDVIHSLEESLSGGGVIRLSDSSDLSLPSESDDTACI